VNLARRNKLSATEYLAKRDEYLERELRKVLRENPSLPLREVERRLGYKNGSSLRKRFPQLSAAILANHKAYRQRQATELVHKLQSVLTEDEPPSLASVARWLNQERSCRVCRTGTMKFAWQLASLVSYAAPHHQRVAIVAGIDSS
jgi:hypothetical protein